MLLAAYKRLNGPPNQMTPSTDDELRFLDLPVAINKR